MRRIWIYALFAGLIAIPARPQDNEPELFQRLTFSTLSQQLQEPSGGSSQALMEALMEGSGLEESEVRHRLLALLDRLDAARQEQSEVWKDLISMGKKKVSAKQATRFLRELIQEARKKLGKKGDYVLRSIVVRAAEKARMMPYQGKDFLLAALSAGAGGPAGNSSDLPEKIGVLVEGQSSYPIDPTGFADLLRTAEDKLNYTKIKDIHVPIRAFLVQELAESQHIKWALEKTHPRLQPDCQLFFEIGRFECRAGTVSTETPSSSETQSSVEPPEPLPILYVALQVVLKHLSSGNVVYSEQIDVTYDFALEQDDQIQSLRLLDNSNRRVAQEIARQLDEFLGR